LNAPVGATSAGNHRQITDGIDDEVDPCYLPDGGIVYASDKAHRYTPCGANNVANLWCCDADGRNQRRLSAGMDAERTPWVMADGRICFAKWDYVHRGMSGANYLGLWAINPDGTRTWILNGNKDFYSAGWPGYVKPIPNSNRLVCTINDKHGLTGLVATLDPARGPYNPQSVSLTSLGNPESTVDVLNKIAAGHALWKTDYPPTGRPPNQKGPDGRSLNHYVNWSDPYPFSEDCFLVTNYGENGQELCVMDGKGNYEVIYSMKWENCPAHKINIEGREVPIGQGVFLTSVRPLMPRKREPVIPATTNWSKRTGTLIMSDIYQGMRFGNVKRGSITSLMVLENLPQPLKYDFEGCWSLGVQTNSTRYWGSVPVEPDGSAYFNVPAVRSLSFVAVNDQGREVKYMRSQMTVMPGEVTGCIGCHENRSKSYKIQRGNLLALKRPPSQLTVPASIRHTPVSYTKDIQPILNKNCVSCHNSDKPEGHIILEGDHTPYWSVSYVHLFASRTITTIGDPNDGDDPVQPIMAATSPLIRYLSGGHHSVKASPEELLTVRTWIDEDASYAPISMTKYSGRVTPMDPVPPVDTRVLMRRCDSCHVDAARYPNTPAVSLCDKYGRNCDFGAWPMAQRIGYGGRYEALVNLDHPEKSLLLRAPLSKAAGGLGWCLQADALSKKGGWQQPKGEPTEVFKSKDDPDYQQLLKSIQDASAYFTANIRRFDMPGYQPCDYLVRYYKNWGIIPKDYDVSKLGWDAEALDDLYFGHALFPDMPFAPGPAYAASVNFEKASK